MNKLFELLAPAIQWARKHPWRAVVALVVLQFFAVASAVPGGLVADFFRSLLRAGQIVILLSLILALWSGRRPKTAPVAVGVKAAGDDLAIGSVPIPTEAEPLHFLIEGGIGTGKSLAINRMLASIRARGGRALVVDSGGEAMARLWRAGDVILNPLDARAAAWSPFAEMRSAHDAVRISKSMVPDRDGHDSEWMIYSQTLIAAVMQRLHERGEATNERLLYFLTVAKSDEIEALVAGLPAQTLFDVGAAKMLSSVRGIIGSHLPAYQYLPPGAGADAFSVRRWVTEGQGWLWVPYSDDQLASVRGLASAWLGEATNAVLSLRPAPERRLWIALDELASLGRVQALGDALSKGRKYGLCAVLGLQSVSQLREAYGRDSSQTLLSCLSSWLVLRAPDGETAEYLSRALGEREIVRPEHSSSKRGLLDRSNSTSLRHVTERAVLPSEISSLPPRRGYLRLGTDPGVIRLINIPVVDLGAEVVPPFVPHQPNQGVSHEQQN